MSNVMHLMLWHTNNKFAAFLLLSKTEVITFSITRSIMKNKLHVPEMQMHITSQPYKDTLMGITGLQVDRYL